MPTGLAPAERQDAVAEVLQGVAQAVLPLDAAAPEVAGVPDAPPAAVPAAEQRAAAVAARPAVAAASPDAPSAMAPDAAEQLALPVSWVPVLRLSARPSVPPWALFWAPPS